MQEQGKVILDFQVQRSVINLYKNFLGTLESLQERHIQMMEKLETLLPKEHHSTLMAVDYFTEDEFNYLRKRVLDIGNETVREIKSAIEKVNNLYEV